MENSKLIKTISLGLGVLLLLLVGWWVKTSYLDKPTLITVMGEGRVAASPQIVRFRVNITNQASSSTLVLADNNRLVREMIAILKSAGVEEKDITVSYPRVVPPTAALGQTNYQAINVAEVTLRNIAKFDNLVGSLYYNCFKANTARLSVLADEPQLRRRRSSKAGVSKPFGEAEPFLHEVKETPSLRAGGGFIQLVFRALPILFYH